MACVVKISAKMEFGFYENNGNSQKIVDFSGVQTLFDTKKVVCLQNKSTFYY